jgi:hypothetical protein
MTAPSQDLQSLDDIEGTTWGPAPEDATTLVAKVHELREKPVGELTSEDLRLLVGQQVGVDVLLPRVLELLKRDPLTEGDFYPGDLLAAVLRLPRSYWQQHSSLADAVLAVLDSINELPPELETDVANFRGAGDGLAGR